MVNQAKVISKAVEALKNYILKKERLLASRDIFVISEELGITKDELEDILKRGQKLAFANKPWFSKYLSSSIF